MTRRLLIAVAVVLAGGLAYVGYRVLWPTEEDRLRAAMDALASTATTPDVEGDLPRLARVQRIREFLVEKLLVEVEGGPVLGGREALVGALAQASAVGPLHVRLTDVTVRLEPGARTAAVTATVEVERRDPRSGQHDVDAREVEMTWIRPDSSWLLEAAKVVRPLK